MASIEISERLAKKLNELAQRENITTEDLLESWIDEHSADIPQDATEENEPINGLLMIAKAAEEAGLRSGQSDVAARSREILQHEIPEKMTRRSNDLFDLITQAADELGEGSQTRDISTRSREILNTEFPDDLMRRMREQRHDNKQE